MTRIVKIAKDSSKLVKYLKTFFKIEGK